MKAEHPFTLDGHGQPWRITALWDEQGLMLVPKEKLPCELEGLRGGPVTIYGVGSFLQTLTCLCPECAGGKKMHCNSLTCAQKLKDNFALR